MSSGLDEILLREYLNESIFCLSRSVCLLYKPAGDALSLRMEGLIFPSK